MTEQSPTLAEQLRANAAAHVPGDPGASSEILTAAADRLEALEEVARTARRVHDHFAAHYSGPSLDHLAAALAALTQEQP